MIHIRLLHHVEELARISAQALHIAPLALRIDRIKGQRRLARARQTGDHHQLVTRNIHVDILQVVLACTANFDVFQLGHVTPQKVTR